MMIGKTAHMKLKPPSGNPYPSLRLVVIGGLLSASPLFVGLGHAEFSAVGIKNLEFTGYKLFAVDLAMNFIYAALIALTLYAWTKSNCSQYNYNFNKHSEGDEKTKAFFLISKTDMGQLSKYVFIYFASMGVFFNTLNIYLLPKIDFSSLLQAKNEPWIAMSIIVTVALIILPCILKNKVIQNIVKETKAQSNILLLSCLLAIGGIALSILIAHPFAHSKETKHLIRQIIYRTSFYIMLLASIVLTFFIVKNLLCTCNKNMEKDQQDPKTNNLFSIDQSAINSDPPSDEQSNDSLDMDKKWEDAMNNSYACQNSDWTWDRPPTHSSEETDKINKSNY